MADHDVPDERRRQYDRAMSVASLAESERLQLCDLMFELGPGAPTVPEGWRVLDLAAHLVVREHDLWAAGGIVIRPLAPLLELAMERRRRRGLDRLIEQIRRGPPRLWDLLPAGAQLSEYFIHHEDVRRANEMSPRPADRELDEGLAKLVGPMAKRSLRRVDAGLDVTWNGGVLYRHGSEPRAELSGPPGELLLYLSGRQRVADVTLTGTEEATAAITAADLAI
jgi:uncharacterized protein (TIGR03085 family)